MNKQLWIAAFAVLALLLIASCPAYGAISGTTEWDVRTTASDNNGGGFDTSATGTDRSQQDAAFIAFTDLVIGATTTQATSTAHPFDSTSPGNIVNVLSGGGCTVQRAQVVSVSGSTATFDKALGTAASTCTANLGGALATPATAVSKMVAGNTLWLKTVSYTITAALAITGSNSWNLVGYSSTHGDNGKATITTATDSINMISAPTGVTLVVKNIIFTTTATTRASVIFENSGTVSVSNSSMTGFNNGIQCVGGGTNVFLTNTAIVSTAGSAITGPQGTVEISYGYIYGGTSAQLAISTALNVRIANSIVAAGAGVGVSINPAGLATILNSTIAVNGGIGIFDSGSITGALHLQSSIIYGNGGLGLSTTATKYGIFVANNAWGSNTGGNYSASVPAGAGDVALTATPFTNSASQDFSLNPTAGGGALCKGAGFPGAFPGGSTTGHLDIGPAQSSGGGTASGYACGFSRNLPPPNVFDAPTTKEPFTIWQQ